MNFVQKFKNQTLKTKTRIFSIFFFSFVFVMALLIILLGVRRVFNSEAKQKLDQVGRFKILQLESALKSQIDLVLKMCTSPSVISFIENPENAGSREVALAEIKSYTDTFLSKYSFFISDADLCFYSNCEFLYKVNPEEPDSYWYKMTLEETDTYNFNINYNSELKRSSLWINAVIRNADGKSIGMAGTEVPLDEIFSQVFDGLDDGVEMCFYNKDLEVMGSLDTSLIENKASVVQVFPELSVHTLFLTTDDFIAVGTKSGEYGMMPVTGLDWHLAVFIPFSASYIFKSSLFITSVVMILITFVIVMIFNYFIMGILRTMARVLSETKEKASVQSRIVGSVNETFSSNIKHLEDFGSMMGEQSGRINEAEHKIMNLLTQLSSMDALRIASLSDTKNLEKSSNVGSSQLIDLNEKINALGDCASRLYSANDLISSVTDQTSLLAINAAIEAAHAGDQGAGFAVVAKEIRNLAEKSRVQEEEVSASIESMNKMVESMILYTETLKESFSRIVESSQSVVASFEEMSVSIEQQNQLGNSIGENLRNINASVESTTEKFGEMKSENVDIAKDVENVSKNAGILLESAESALEVTGM
ncbi:MAG: hypothetical protein IJP61_09905 [Treponema sp.]|nr:hypothetical protein [Treponema sp.]